MWPGPRPTFVPSDILIHPAVWPQKTWAENWGLCPFGKGDGCASDAVWPRSRPTWQWMFCILLSCVFWTIFLHVFMHVNVSGRSALLFNKLIDWLIATSVLSFILIHPKIWPQYTNVTDRQTDRTDRQTTVRQHRANRFTNGRSKNDVMLPAAVARSFSDDNTIRYVLPVCGWRHFCP